MGGETFLLMELHKDVRKEVFCRDNSGYTYLSSFNGRHGGVLLVSALVSGLSASGLSPGRGHRGLFVLGQELISCSTSLHPGVQMGTGYLMLGINLRWTSIPSRGE